MLDLTRYRIEIGLVEKDTETVATMPLGIEQITQEQKEILERLQMDFENGDFA